MSDCSTCASDFHCLVDHDQKRCEGTYPFWRPKTCQGCGRRNKKDKFGYHVCELPEGSCNNKDKWISWHEYWGGGQKALF